MTSSPTSVSSIRRTTWRVTWGLANYEDFHFADEAQQWALWLSRRYSNVEILAPEA